MPSFLGDGQYQKNKETAERRYARAVLRYHTDPLFHAKAVLATELAMILDKEHPMHAVILALDITDEDVYGNNPGAFGPDAQVPDPIGAPPRPHRPDAKPS